MEVNQILEKLSQLELKIDEQNLLQKEHDNNCVKKYSLKYNTLHHI